MIGRAAFTYDELLTLVVKTEAVLNSRPLSYISSDDLKEPLTPSHLLTGYRVLSLPDPPGDIDPDYQESASSLRRRMVHVAKVSERFWRQWRREYLVELREFHSTIRLICGVNTTLKEGEVVTVYDKNQPRGLWRLSRIMSTIEGTDGNIRGAHVHVLSKKGRTMIIQ